MQNGSVRRGPAPAEKAGRSGKLLSRYVWLIYSAFFFVEPILDHNRKQWIGIAIFYPIFLFLYLYPEDHRKGSRWCVLGLYLAALIYMPINPSSSGSLIYVAAFLPFVVANEKRMLALLGAGIGLFCLVGWLLHISPWAWATMALIAVVVGLANLGQAREHNANARLRRANEEIEHLAKVAERERIARDLHDLLGHTLSMITLKAELAGKLLEHDPARARREIADVEETARRALTEVRQAVRGYRSEGLASELERAQHTLATAGSLLIKPNEMPRNLTPAMETVLAMIVREAVTNIVRHARARRVEITLAEVNSQVQLQITDDGRGGILGEGSGMRGMRERIEALGGVFKYNCPPRNGTILNFTLPLPGSVRLMPETELHQAAEEQPA